jgi:hypothetical protein
MAMFGQVARRWRPAAIPLAAVTGLLTAYAVVLVVGLPAFERVKPTRRLARIVAGTARPEDHVGMYRLNRWSSSWRFYVDRHSDRLETDAEVAEFFSRPGRHYCAMLRHDYERLAAGGMRLRVIYEETGLFTTTGRSLQAGAAARKDGFIIVTEYAPTGT